MCIREGGGPAPKGPVGATEDAGAAADLVVLSGNDGEVVAVAPRRQVSNADKRRILLAAERRTKPGDLGGLMRPEGGDSRLFYTSLSPRGPTQSRTPSSFWKKKIQDEAVKCLHITSNTHVRHLDIGSNRHHST